MSLELKIYQNGSKKGVLRQNRVIVPAEYDYITFGTRNGNIQEWIIAWKNPVFGHRYSLEKESPIDGETIVFCKNGGTFKLFYHGAEVKRNIHSISQLDKNYFMALTHTEEGKEVWCVFEHCGNVVIPFESGYERISGFHSYFYDEMYQHSQKFLKVSINVSYEWDEKGWRRTVKRTEGVVDLNNNIYIPIEFDCVFVPFSNEDHNFIKVRKGDRFGLFDLEGNLVFPLIYNEIDLYHCSKDDEKKYIRLHLGGERICDEYKGYLRGGYWQLYSLKNHFLSQTHYDAIKLIDSKDEKYSNYIAEAVLDGNAGFVTINFEFLPDDNMKNEIGKIQRRSNELYDNTPEKEYVGWTDSELKDLYMAAYEGDPDAMWNTD